MLCTGCSQAAEDYASQGAGTAWVWSGNPPYSFKWLLLSYLNFSQDSISNKDLHFFGVCVHCNVLQGPDSTLVVGLGVKRWSCKGGSTVFVFQAFFCPLWKHPHCLNLWVYPPSGVNVFETGFKLIAPTANNSLSTAKRCVTWSTVLCHTGSRFYRRTVRTIYALPQFMRKCIVRQSRMHAVDFVSCRTLRVRKTPMIGAPVVDVVGALQEVLTHLEIPVIVMSHRWRRDFMHSPNV